MTGFRLRTASLAVLIVLFASCESPFGGLSLTVEVEEQPSAAMSIGPEPAEPVEYHVTGAGPAGASFSRTVTELPLTVRGLTNGEWRIDVAGIDGAGHVVLQGSGVAFVSDEEIRLARIVLAPPAGTGSVRIELSWPAELVAEPQPEAVVHVGETPVATLDCTVRAGDGEATCTVGSVASGWYRLEIRLYDGGKSVAGRADLLSVIAGATTDADLALPRINKPGRRIQISGAGFRLAWDAGEPDPADPVTHYKVYYRENGTYLWSYLGSTDGTVERFDVSTGMLEYGTYDFAVTAISASGGESKPLTSLCDEAEPQTGWFVEWSPGS